MQAMIETIFDAAYLVGVVTVGMTMMKNSRGNKQTFLFGLMSVLLGCGDAFHLVPCAYSLWTTGLEANAVALGIGKLITSITMTIFYVILYHIWRERYDIKGKKGITNAIYALAVVRIGLCLLPQNQWLNYHAPISWGIYRNIPFAIMGSSLLFFFTPRQKNIKTKGFSICGWPLYYLLPFIYPWCYGQV